MECDAVELEVEYAATAAATLSPLPNKCIVAAVATAAGSTLLDPFDYFSYSPTPFNRDPKVAPPPIPLLNNPLSNKIPLLLSC